MAVGEVDWSRYLRFNQVGRWLEQSAGLCLLMYFQDDMGTFVVEGGHRLGVGYALRGTRTRRHHAWQRLCFVERNA